MSCLWDSEACTVQSTKRRVFLMLCFWLSGFFNSDAGGRAIIIMLGVACETKSRNLRVSNSKNFPSKNLLLNGLQYHAGI